MSRVILDAQNLVHRSLHGEPAGEQDNQGRANCTTDTESDVGVGDPSNNRLGSSVGERLACYGVVPGSIPGLAYAFLFLQAEHKDTRHLVAPTIKRIRGIRIFGFSVQNVFILQYEPLCRVGTSGFQA